MTQHITLWQRPKVLPTARKEQFASIFNLAAADLDLRTGAVLGPPAQNGVPSYKVVVEGDEIKVEV